MQGTTSRSRTSAMEIVIDKIIIMQWLMICRMHNKKLRTILSLQKESSIQQENKKCKPINGHPFFDDLTWYKWNFGPNSCAHTEHRVRRLHQATFPRSLPKFTEQDFFNTSAITATVSSTVFNESWTPRATFLNLGWINPQGVNGVLPGG